MEFFLRQQLQVRRLLSVPFALLVQHECGTHGAVVWLWLPLMPPLFRVAGTASEARLLSFLPAAFTPPLSGAPAGSSSYVFVSFPLTARVVTGKGKFFLRPILDAERSGPACLRGQAFARAGDAALVPWSACVTDVFNQCSGRNACGTCSLQKSWDKWGNKHGVFLVLPAVTRSCSEVACKGNLMARR